MGIFVSDVGALTGRVYIGIAISLKGPTTWVAAAAGYPRCTRVVSVPASPLQQLCSTRQSKLIIQLGFCS